ncbi:MAG: OmpA family protein [Candidatus Scalindua sp.]|nr:OmpA family protein [Candidatus Scalindua sp.]
MEEEKGADANAWVASFGDLITLLMTFFVLIISMSVIKMDEIVEAINKNDGLGDNLVSADLKETGIFEKQTMSKIQLLMEGDGLPPPLEDIEFLHDSVVVFVSENSLDNVIDLEKTRNGFIIRIRADILFDPGNTKPKDQYLYLLDEIAELLGAVSNDVRIEGHTDDRYSEDVYEDIRLSVSRATSICGYFVDRWNMDPSRIGVAGYGKHRPLFPNIDEENRAMNRRVEIIVKEQGQEDG